MHLRNLKQKVLLVALSIAAHVLFIAALYVVGSWIKNARISNAPKSENINIEVRLPPPPSDLPDVETPAPTVAKKETPKPPPKKAEPPPPDPIAPPPPPAQAPPPAQPVVGLNLDSTASNGEGANFAVGNTRMGDTDTTAKDPNAIAPLPPQSNKAATRIPVVGVRLTKPVRKLELLPDYPEELRSQAIEADVAVVLIIDATGAVKEARIARSSRYPELDAAALTAARKEQFYPATRNGEAIEYTLAFTYRFRLND